MVWTFPFIKWKKACWFWCSLNVTNDWTTFQLLNFFFSVPWWKSLHQAPFVRLHKMPCIFYAKLEPCCFHPVDILLWASLRNVSHSRTRVFLLKAFLHLFVFLQFSPVLVSSDGWICPLLIISPRPGNWWSSWGLRQGLNALR